MFLRFIADNGRTALPRRFELWPGSSAALPNPERGNEAEKHDSVGFRGVGGGSGLNSKLPMDRGSRLAHPIPRHPGSMDTIQAAKEKADASKLMPALAKPAEGKAELKNSVAVNMQPEMRRACLRDHGEGTLLLVFGTRQGLTVW